MPQSHSARFRVDPASWPPRGVPEVDRDELAPICRIVYHCPRGAHEFTVPFADDAEVEIPEVWECRQHGVAGRRDGAAPGRRKTKPPRTHWVMLLERRTIPELHELLQERLTLLGHGSQLEPLPPAATSRRR